MQLQVSKVILAVIVTAIIVGGGVYYWQTQNSTFGSLLLKNENTKEKVFEYFENKDYATDGKNIYINVYDGGSSWIENYQIAKNIDKDSFQLLSTGYNSYFKDKNGVYYNTFSTYENLDDNIKFLKNINPETIKIASYHCITDKNGVYCDTPYDKIEKNIDMKKVLEADQETFVSLGKEEIYFKDKNNVFCNKYQKGINIQKLDNADVESFSIVANSSLDKFGKDKNNVFLLCNKVEGIEDVDSFEITQGNNGKDKLFEYTIDDSGTITKKAQ